MVFSQHGVARQKVDAWFKKKNIQPSIYAQVSGNEAILSMVSLGCGVGVVPSLVIENSPIRHRIVRLNIKPALPPYPVGIFIHKKKAKSRLIQSFWQMAASSDKGDDE